MRAASIRCPEKDTQRLILLFIFSFSLLMLWEAWDKRAVPARRARRECPAGSAAPAKPGARRYERKAGCTAGAVPGADATAKGETVRITTDF